jgi:hypothetical protein
MQNWKLVYIFRLKAYWRRIRSRCTRRSRCGDGRHWQHPYIHKCTGEAIRWLTMDYTVSVKGSDAPPDRSSPKPLAYQVISTLILCLVQLIAMHICFQVCCLVMNEWRVASNINSGLSKDEILNEECLVGTWMLIYLIFWWLIEINFENKVCATITLSLYTYIFNIEWKMIVH